MVCAVGESAVKVETRAIIFGVLRKIQLASHDSGLSLHHRGVALRFDIK